MVAVLQRVSRAAVSVENRVAAEIGPGLAILLGVDQEDSEEDSDFLVKKTATLRIFSDGLGRMNRSIIDTGGNALVVSQFTLVADWRKGRRPSFTRAAPPEQAERLYVHFSNGLRAAGIIVENGVFGANMEFNLVNDGPVTFVLDSKER